MIYSLSCFAKTKSGQCEYVIDFCEVPTLKLQDFVNKEKFDSLCENGCPNYSRKWSCPPYAPSFADFVAGWERLFIVYMRINMSQFSYINNNYLKIKAANTILKSRADKFLREMASKYGSYISTGSCRLCKPCKRKIELPCAHPELMTFSFESMGVDVCRLVDSYFYEPLLWYKSHYLPSYTSVVCGILTNAEITINDLKVEYLDYT